jgi:hypothetical protein
MSDYIKATNFAIKDTLLTGNPNKIIKGTEIDTEFSAIASAVSSKADINSPTFTGTPAAPTAASGSNTTQVANTAFVHAERTNVATLTNKTLTSPILNTPTINTATISGGSISGITDLAVADGGTGSSTLAANHVLLGNGTSALQTVAPSTSGNILTSTGTTWTSAPVDAVRAVTAGNGLQGGTITNTGTLSIAAPGFNTIGSYIVGGAELQTASPPQTLVSGGDYAAGSGIQQIRPIYTKDATQITQGTNISGTWRWMSAPVWVGAAQSEQGFYSGICCRVS